MQVLREQAIELLKELGVKGVSKKTSNKKLAEHLQEIDDLTDEDTEIEEGELHDLAYQLINLDEDDLAEVEVVEELDEEPKKKKGRKKKEEPEEEEDDEEEYEEDDEEGEEPEEEEDDEETLVSLGEAADEGDAKSEKELIKLAKKAKIDPDEYETWVELAEALEEEDEEEEEEKPKKRGRKKGGKKSPSKRKRKVDAWGSTVGSGAAEINALVRGKKTPTDAETLAARTGFPMARINPHIRWMKERGLIAVVDKEGRKQKFMDAELADEYSPPKKKKGADKKKATKSKAKKAKKGGKKKKKGGKKKKK